MRSPTSRSARRGWRGSGSSRRDEAASRPRFNPFFNNIEPRGSRAATFAVPHNAFFRLLSGPQIGTTITRARRGSTDKMSEIRPPRHADPYTPRGGLISDQGNSRHKRSNLAVLKLHRTWAHEALVGPGTRSHKSIRCAGLGFRPNPAP